MRVCEGDACEFVVLSNSGYRWKVQNNHPTQSIRVQFDGVRGGSLSSVDLEPGQSKVLFFAAFLGNWHANFIN